MKQETLAAKLEAPARTVLRLAVRVVTDSFGGVAGLTVTASVIGIIERCSTHSSRIALNRTLPISLLDRYRYLAVCRELKVES